LRILQVRRDKVFSKIIRLIACELRNKHEPVVSVKGPLLGVGGSNDTFCNCVNCGEFCYKDGKEWRKDLRFVTIN
jgi:hypothetical protein